MIEIDKHSSRGRKARARVGWELAALALLLVLTFLPSCSTKKNTRASRFYHAFTSRYNIYYNGKVSFDEALKAQQTGYKENYTDMILMYPISAQPKDKAEPGGPFDRAIEKSNKAIKLHSIRTKPKKKPGWRNDPKERKWQEQEEYNPFLKKCWMLLGESQFYNADFLQASATFSYIARHYATDELMVAEAKLWQARCYAEMDWLYEAEDILAKLNKDGIPAKSQEHYATVYADYLVKNKQFEEAIPYLQKAIKAEPSRLQRSRMRYLLGQIYTTLELDGLAYQAFKKVARSNPPYELEFAARIRQTEVYPGGDYRKVVKQLERMAKNQKNKDMLDQVYYALGNVYLNHEDTVNAIKSYELGVEKSTQMGMDQAICQIRLGDLYFQKRDYIKAQPNFSGALSIIQKEYKDYDRVSKLSAVLDELVVHAEAVHLQDSLQTLAKMPEAERLAVIDKIIERVKKEEEEAKALAEKEAYLAEQEAKGTGIDRPGTEVTTMTIPTAGGGSSFYFYNPQTVSQGKAQFQRKWGRRPLEDDWRRRDKRMTTFDEPMEDETEGEETDELLAEGETPEAAVTDSSAVAADDPKSREYYLQQLPMTPEDIAASNVIIIDGLYNMAMIYKDKLEDLPLAISAFEELERRFPDNEHLLESYFQVYLMALRNKDAVLASTYKDKIQAKFPGSDYAVAVADPNYEYNIRMMDTVQDSIYEHTYERYLASDIATVRQNFRMMGEKYPLAKLMPKFMFLDALTYVQEGNPEGFKAALRALVEKYPDADVTELAGEMLKGVLRGRAMVQGDIKGMTWNLRFGAEDGELSAADSARVFKADKNVPYRMLLVFPTDGVDKNQLLFSVAAYNFANMMVKEFDLSIEPMGPLSMLIISGFYNFDEILHYYKMIYGKDGYATAIESRVAILPISDDNYETLMRGKTLDEYVSFFEANFSDVAPELAARWRARMEADMEASEAAESDSIPTEPVPVPEPTPAVDSVAPLQIVRPLPLPEVQDSLPAVWVQEVIDVPQDSVQVTGPVQEDPGLTLKDIEEIRKREAEEEEARREEARKAFEAEQEAEKALREQKAKEREELEKQQKAEEEALLKAKREREKQLERERKEKLKQAEADRKAKLKAREQLRKEKEKAYKERLKQREQERKAKEKAYKQKLKEREKARKAELKAKEQARKEAQKAKEAERKARLKNR